MINIVINGAGGTMGRVVAAMGEKYHEAYTVVAGIDRFTSQGETLSIPVYDSFDKITQPYDAIIDFSMPEALPSVIEAACMRKCALVVATTGLQKMDYERIRAASAIIPICIAANMSLGVNLQMQLAQKAAAALGENYDIEIVEKHHNRKIDAPSGTALALANAVSKQFPFGKDIIFERHSLRQKRNKREIGIHSIRGGTVVGEHNVIFLGDDEVIEIKHTAYSKQIYASGALRAASFLHNKPAKLYPIQEIVAEEHAVTSISAHREQSIFTIPRVSHDMKSVAEIFTALADENINIDMISQTILHDGHVNIAFTLPCNDVPAALRALEPIVPDVSHVDDVSKLCIEGAGMEHRPGVAAQVFRILAQQNIEVSLVTTSETKISFCLNEKDVTHAMEAVSAAFGL